jgi:hypothetical protein
MAANVVTDLSQIAQILELDVQTVVRRVALDLHKRIVEKTPVDTGRARASWTLNPGRPDRSVAPEDTQLSAEAATQTALAQQAKAATTKPYEAIWLSNNVVYITQLESGSSQQAPAGMVAVSLAEIETELQAIINTSQ